jgi:hypothetical protein
MFSNSVKYLNNRSFKYKFNQPFNQVVEFYTNIDIFKKINFFGLIEKIDNSNKKKFFEKDYTMVFIWKKVIKIEFITIDYYQKQGQFCFSMKINKINSFKLPFNIIITTKFFEDLFDNSTLIIYEIGIGNPYQNSIANNILSLILNSPYLIQEKEFIAINKLIEKYIKSCKKEYIIYQSILINKPPLDIWNFLTNVSYIVNIVLKIPNHYAYSKGEKGKVGSNSIIYNTKTGYNINFRIKNAKINNDKIIVYMKKNVNCKKAVNHKLKIIITEISNNISLLQLEQNIPIYCNGIVVNTLKNFTKYFLEKCKIHIEKQ